MQHERQSIDQSILLSVRQVLPELLQRNARADGRLRLLWAAAVTWARGGTANSGMLDLHVQTTVRSRKVDSATTEPAPEVHRCRCESPDSRRTKGRYKRFLEAYPAWTISMPHRIEYSRATLAFESFRVESTLVTRLMVPRSF